MPSCTNILNAQGDGNVLTSDYALKADSTCWDHLILFNIQKENLRVGH